MPVLSPQNIYVDNENMDLEGLTTQNKKETEENGELELANDENPLTPKIQSKVKELSIN